MTDYEACPPQNQPLDDQIARLGHLERENQQLATQVKQLMRAERVMIESQDKLDQQVSFYRQLNEIAKRLKTTFKPEEIVTIAMEFMVYDLNFERCLIWRGNAPVTDADATTTPKLWQAFLWDGYEDDAPQGRILTTADHVFAPLFKQSDGFEPRDFILSFLDAPIETNLGPQLGLDEFILCAIPSQHQSPPYLIAIGNTTQRAKLFSRVTANADYLVVLANLLAQVSGAISQALLYQSTRHQAETLRTTLKTLQSTQSQLIQTEKMSSLGQLVAGIAHEINNPVNFIDGNLAYTATYSNNLLTLINAYQQAQPQPSDEIQALLEKIDFEFLSRDFPKVIASMQLGTSRIQAIVLSLRNFSRMDESEFQPVNLHDGVESTLLILQHRFKLDHNRPAIALIKDYGDLPIVECAAGLVNQVLMNLLSNAIDAFESNYTKTATTTPTITIITRADSSHIWIRIIDNGSGIPQSIQHRLFDPFFTTKPVGKGTGLGLSISYQIIVEKHGGTLECRSTIGQGTEFRIGLPLKISPNPIGSTIG
jgi:signal transduction histidine kinase